MPDPHEQDPTLLERALDRTGLIAKTSLAIAAISFGGSGIVLGEESPSKLADVTYQTGPTPLENIGEREKQLARKALSSSVKTDKIQTQKKHTTTTIRKKANDIQFGYADAQKGDSAQTVDGGYREKGWVYSAVRLKNALIRTEDGDSYRKDIYKCGFVKEGVLPNKPSRTGAIGHCRDYLNEFRNNRYAFFKNYNCPEVKPGLEGCRDGTYFSRITEACTQTSKKDFPLIYRNFETDEPSPMNVFGTGDGGFRGVIKENRKTSVRYRAQIRGQSMNGKAIVVRAPEWGVMPNECVAADDRSGGTKTIVG